MTHKSTKSAMTHIRHVIKTTSALSDIRASHAICGAILEAIDWGLKFGPNDFKSLAKQLRRDRWIGQTNGTVERFYKWACGVGEYSHDTHKPNPSAVASIEKWLKRTPFIWVERTRNPQRLCVGSQLTWNGERVTVTSFNDKEGSLTACKYKKDEANQNDYAVSSVHYFDGKYREIQAITKYDDGCIAVRLSSRVRGNNREIERRFTITPAELSASRKDFDKRRRQHENAVKAATTLDEVEAARKAAADEGKENWRHFDIEILGEAIEVRREEIKKEMDFAARAAYEAEERKRYTESHAKELGRWIAGEEVGIYLGASDIRIRIRGDYVETSNGHMVSIRGARIALKFIKAHRAGWEANGKSFNVDIFPMRRISPEGVQIGCTLLPWAEVERCEALIGEKAPE